MSELEFKDVTGEESRVYIYPDGSRYRAERVLRICVRPSGGHRLELATGRKVVVAPGWVAIEIDAKDWSL